MVAIGMADQGSSDLNKQKKMKVELEDGGVKVVWVWFFFGRRFLRAVCCSGGGDEVRKNKREKKKFFR